MSCGEAISRSRAEICSLAIGMSEIVIAVVVDKSPRKSKSSIMMSSVDFKLI